MRWSGRRAPAGCRGSAFRAPTAGRPARACRVPRAAWSGRAGWWLDRYFSTWITAFSGSTIRKYTTALTLTETLSRVITSCGGTSMTTVRRSMRTICCTAGMSRKKPGPLTFQKRPSMNTTARSYSRRTRNDITASSTTMTQTFRIPVRWPSSGSLDRRRRVARTSVRPLRPVTRTLCPRLSGTGLSTRHCSPWTRAQPSASTSSSVTPMLPISSSSPVTIGRRRAFTATPSTRNRKRRGGDDERADQGRRYAEAGHVGVDQHHRADRERDDASDSERAIGGEEHFGDHEGEAKQDEPQPRVVDGQHLQGERARASAKSRRARRAAQGPGS